MGLGLGLGLVGQDEGVEREEGRERRGVEEAAPRAADGVESGGAVD